MVSISNLSKAVHKSEALAMQSSSEPSKGSSTADRLLYATSTYDASQRQSGYGDAAQKRIEKPFDAGAQNSDNEIISGLVTAFNTTAQSNPAAIRASLQQAFGEKASSAQLDALANQIATGDVPMPANIEFVEAESMGAGSYGAYSPENGGTIYLDERLKDKPELMQSVFNEELGHHFDNVLGGADASGDEGAVFAQSLKSGPLAQTTLAELKSEQDNGFIEVDGKQVAVEFYDGVGSSPEAGGSESSSSSSSSSNSGNSDNDEKRKSDSKPTSTPQTQNTSDGPGGGDPDQFEQLTGISSNTTTNNTNNSDNDENRKPESKPTSTPSTTSNIVIDPSVRDDNTADGPAGGDPDAFEGLTGISSDWSSDNDDDRSGANPVNVPASPSKEGGFLSNVWDWLGDNIAEPAFDTISGLVSDVVLLGASAVDRVADTVGDLVKPMVDFGMNLGEAAVGLVEDTLLLGNHLFNKPIETIVDLGRGVFEIGQNLFSGNFAEAWDFFKDTVSDLALAPFEFVVGGVALFGNAIAGVIDNTFGLADSRPLTQAEIDYLQQAYPHMDLSTVTITTGGIKSLFMRSHVVGNEIFLSDDQFIGGDPANGLNPIGFETLGHEAAHVDQYRNDGPGYAGDALVAQMLGILGLGPGYETESAITEGVPYDELNHEQQANIMGRSPKL